MTKIIQVATAVIFNSNGECLYALRPDNVKRPGLWENPGGKLERGETVAEAAIRECREELGVEIAVVGFLATISMDLVTQVIVLHAVAARIIEGDPKPLASQSLQWVDPQYAVDHMPCSPGTYPIHRAVMTYLNRTK